MLTLLISSTLRHSVRVLKKNQMKNLELSYLTFFIVPIVFGCNHVKDPIWTISLKGDGLPPKVEYADTSVIIVSYIDRLYCVDNKTGKKIFTSEFEYFSELHFDSCLYFFKDKDLFVKINPFSPDEEWELQATNYSFLSFFDFNLENVHLLYLSIITSRKYPSHCKSSSLIFLFNPHVFRCKYPSSY